jgi:hypothetical protein
LKTCPKCGSHKIIYFDSDNDMCESCKEWFPALGENEPLENCTLLVLCKKELFFTKKGGKDVVSSWYPVSKEAASVISLYFKIPLSYDGGKNIDNDKVLNKAFKETKDE